MTSRQRVRVYLPDELQTQRDRPDESMLRWARHDGAEIARQRAESLGGKLAGLVGLSSNVSVRDVPLLDECLDGLGLGPLERSIAKYRKREWFVDYAVERQHGEPTGRRAETTAEAVRRGGRLD